MIYKGSLGIISYHLQLSQKNIQLKKNLYREKLGLNSDALPPCPHPTPILPCIEEENNKYVMDKGMEVELP